VGRAPSPAAFEVVVEIGVEVVVAVAVAVAIAVVVAVAVAVAVDLALRSLRTILLRSRSTAAEKRVGPTRGRGLLS